MSDEREKEGWKGGVGSVYEDAKGYTESEKESLKHADEQRERGQRELEEKLRKR